MQRHDGKTADVHPDEVENYAAGGFRKVKDASEKAIQQKEQAEDETEAQAKPQVKRRGRPRKVKPDGSDN